MAMKRSLELDGYVADLFARGDDVLAALSTGSYDVLLLDIGLPHMTGLEILGHLRAEGDSTPVIIITALDRTQHRVAGLDAGADDYLVKPVELEELAARVRAQLRRRDRRQKDIMSIDDVTIDFAGHVVTVHDEPIALTSKEFRVLALLMRRNRRFVSKADLEGELYDQDQWVESNTIEVAISSLRRKLGRDFIRTARGLGYMVGGRDG